MQKVPWIRPGDGQTDLATRKAIQKAKIEPANKKAALAEFNKVNNNAR